MRCASVLVVIALAAAPLFAAAQGVAGRNLAAPCAICHGTNGRVPSAAPVIALAGLPRGQIAEQMRAFRDGRRAATVMHQIARGYTDAEIDSLAAFYAAQQR